MNETTAPRRRYFRRSRRTASPKEVENKVQLNGEKSNSDSGDGKSRLISEDFIQNMVDNMLESTRLNRLLYNKVVNVLDHCEKNNSRLAEATSDMIKNNQDTLLCAAECNEKLVMCLQKSFSQTNECIKNLFEQQQQFFCDLKENFESSHLSMVDATSNDNHKEENDQSIEFENNLSDNNQDNDHKPLDLNSNDTSKCNWDTVVANYSDMNLKEELLYGICAYGFDKPSDIQKHAMLSCIRGHDIIAQTHSDADTHAIFSISMLQKIDTNLNECQALILVPTRVSTIEFKNVINTLGKFMHVKCHVSAGATNLREDIKTVLTGVQVIVGTLGRVIDMIRRKVLLVENIKLFVFDDIDKTLDFKKSEIDCFFQKLPHKSQIIILSATVSSNVLELSKSFLKEPVHIPLMNEKFNLESIKQFFRYTASRERKLDTLYEIYGGLSINQTVIFCNRHSTVRRLVDKMNQKKYLVSAVHREMEQNERDLILHQFQSGLLAVLITTDKFACNINAQEFLIVVNYDWPETKRNYFNRIRLISHLKDRGILINLVSGNENKKLREMELSYSIHIHELPTNFTNFISSLRKKSNIAE